MHSQSYEQGCGGNLGIVRYMCENDLESVNVQSASIVAGDTGQVIRGLEIIINARSMLYLSIPSSEVPSLNYIGLLILFRPTLLPSYSGTPVNWHWPTHCLIVPLIIINYKKQSSANQKW